MALPSVVPAPASITSADPAPFAVAAETPIVGDAEAARALRSLVETRTGLTLATRPADAGRSAASDGTEGAIVLEITGDGPA